MEQHVDLRIQKTYHLLHKAFTGLMEEKGFEAITVGELCEHAMIRRATFYKHFADKYEYFSFYMKEIFASFRAQLTSTAGTGASSVPGFRFTKAMSFSSFYRAAA